MMYWEMQLMDCLYSLVKDCCRYSTHCAAFTLQNVILNFLKTITETSEDLIYLFNSLR